MGGAEWQLGTAETVTWPRVHKLPRTSPHRLDTREAVVWV